MGKLEFSNKIRVVSSPDKAKSCPNTRLDFYLNYATTVSETLKKPLFQRFVDWVIRKEKIEKNSVKDIQVRVFPFQNENGKSLAGRCKNNGVILIFPRRAGFLLKKMQTISKTRLLVYLKSRAMATLIHELLHIKYMDDEEEVRRRTRNYFNIFAESQQQKIEHIDAVQKMLFSV